MALKKVNLSDALKAVARGENIEQEKVENNVRELIKEPKGNKVVSTRISTKIISGHFDKAVSTQIKKIALDEESTVQDLLKEALNDLFIKKGRGPIA